MKKISVVVLFAILFNLGLSAQVPYFAGTPGNNKLYGYTSVKFRPGRNAQETYTTFQYGISPFGAAGLDLYTSNGSAYTGFILRGGYIFNKWFGIGVQASPSFNLSDNFKFSYFTGAIYMNGNISSDGKFFWCSNTWLTFNDGASDTFSNWEYLGMNIPLGKGQGITPMAGIIHSWELNKDVDISVGCYYSLRNWNFYLWSDKLLVNHPRVVTGVDFKF